MIEEDHYQMLQTLSELVRARDDDVTEYTLFMLTMMQESASIEEAMSKIVRRVEFVGKMIRRKVGDGMQMAEFSHRLVRNYSLGRNTGSYSFAMKNIETILSLEP
jgi:hypothetical protein